MLKLADLVSAEFPGVTPERLGLLFQIPGWRVPMIRLLVESCPSDPVARQGYLSCLYALNASTLPGAFIRAEDTERFQCQVVSAIRWLTSDAAKLLLNAQSVTPEPTQNPAEPPVSSDPI